MPVANLISQSTSVSSLLVHHKFLFLDPNILNLVPKKSKHSQIGPLQIFVLNLVPHSHRSKRSQLDSPMWLPRLSGYEVESIL